MVSREDLGAVAVRAWIQNSLSLPELFSLVQERRRFDLQDLKLSKDLLLSSRWMRHHGFDNVSLKGTDLTLAASLHIMHVLSHCVVFRSFSPPKPYLHLGFSLGHVMTTSLSRDPERVLSVCLIPHLENWGWFAGLCLVAFDSKKLSFYAVGPERELQEVRSFFLQEALVKMTCDETGQDHTLFARTESGALHLLRLDDRQFQSIATNFLIENSHLEPEMYPPYCRDTPSHFSILSTRPSIPIPFQRRKAFLGVVKARPSGVREEMNLVLTPWNIPRKAFSLPSCVDRTQHNTFKADLPGGSIHYTLDRCETPCGMGHCLFINVEANPPASSRILCLEGLSIESMNLSSDGFTLYLAFLTKIPEESLEQLIRSNRFLDEDLGQCHSDLMRRNPCTPDLEWVTRAAEWRNVGVVSLRLGKLLRSQEDHKDIVTLHFYQNVPLRQGLAPMLYPALVEKKRVRTRLTQHFCYILIYGESLYCFPRVFERPSTPIHLQLTLSLGNFQNFYVATDDSFGLFLPSTRTSYGKKSPLIYLKFCASFDLSPKAIFSQLQAQKIHHLVFDRVSTSRIQVIDRTQTHVHRIKLFPDQRC